MQNQKQKLMFKKLIDTAITWAIYWGIWLLAVILFHKGFATDGPIGFALMLTVGFVAAYISKPLIARLVRYQLVVAIVLIWWVNIYLMSN